MDDIDTDGCPVCWEEFRSPKLLNCKHTICNPCLEGILKKNDEHKIICPLCRQVQDTKNRGTDSIFENYFVKVVPPEIFCCSICFIEANVRTCSHCQLQLCRNCKASHKLALKLSDVRIENESDSEPESEDLDKDADTDNVSLPFHLLLSGQHAKTNLIAELMSTFKFRSLTSVPEEGQDNYISSISPMEDGLCEVIANLGPESAIYDAEGNEKNRDGFDMGISDIIHTSEGRILFSNYSLCLVFEIIYSRVVIFTRTGDFQPTSIAYMIDGRILCVGPNKRLQEENSENENDRHGSLHIFDTEGKLLQKIEHGTNEPYFIFPIKVSVNKNDNTICVSDKDKHCVFIFDEDGNLLRLYEGGSRYVFLLSREFAPRPLCHDPEGNIIVGNMADSTLHVLKPNGEFLGYLVTKSKEKFGQPMTMCFDTMGRLWLGDRKDGVIRVFQIIRYVNSLSPRLF